MATQTRRRRTRTLWFGLIALGIAGVIAWTVWQWWHPKFEIIARSDSPDGKYRCVVREKKPPGPADSPYLYRFTLYSNAARQPLPGEPFRADLGARQIGVVDFLWFGNELKVECRAGCRAEIVDGRQVWRPLEPPTQPAATQAATTPAGD